MACLSQTHIFPCRLRHRLVTTTIPLTALSNRQVRHRSASYLSLSGLSPLVWVTACPLAPLVRREPSRAANEPAEPITEDGSLLITADRYAPGKRIDTATIRTTDDPHRETIIRVVLIYCAPHPPASLHCRTHRAVTTRGVSLTTQRRQNDSNACGLSGGEYEDARFDT